MKKFCISSCSSKPVRWLRILTLVCIVEFAEATDAFAGSPVGDFFFQGDIVARGIVTTEDGSPIVGVSVTVLNGNSGTVTDSLGAFRISMRSGQTLSVSNVGFESRNIIVRDENAIEVKLVSLQTQLNEVIVVGYGSVKKSDVTGAVTSLKKADLPTGSSVSVGQLLSGKAPGVTVRNTNAMPGGGVEILIRGATSTGAGNEPLFVIDGFPVSNGTMEPGNGTSSYHQGDRSPLNSLNPDDIESIEILKDASATAIYGARAANGVVLVTTRRGSRGIEVNYTGQASIQQMRKPFEMLSPRQYMEETNKVMREKWLRENSIAPFGNTDPSSVTPLTPRYTQDQISNVGAGTDWWDLLTRNGTIQSHNVSLSGGSDKVRAFASLGYFDQEGVLRGSNLKRFSGKLNLDYKVSKYFSAGLSLLASQINNSNLQIGEQQWEGSGMIMSALLFDPTVPVKDEDGNYVISNWFANMPNPVSYLDVRDNTKQTRMLTNLFAELTPIRNLKIRGSVGYDAQSSIRKTYYPKSFLFGMQKGGQASINNINRDDYLFDLTASYDISKQDHALTVLGGYAYQQFNDDYYGMTATGFFTDAFDFNNMGAANDRPMIGSARNKSVIGSYFGRINYTFRDRYLVTVNARYDGSDRFGVNNRWGFFPSVALAWKASEESFIRDIRQINNLKLRVSYGQTGNSNIGANAYAFYDVNRTYVFDNQMVIGVSPVQLANPDLRWETTTSANIGLDFGLFNNRVSGVVEVYQKTVSDLLGFRNLRSWMLLPNVAANLGKTQSTGVEVGITTVNIDNRASDFRWTTTVNYTTFNDRWKERSPDVVLAPWDRVDAPLRAVYTYLTDGIVQVGETVPAQPNAVPGNIKVRDINGFDSDLNYTGKPDGKIDEADMVLLGRSDPKFTLGVNNTLKFRRFDFTVFGYGMFGRLVYNQSLLKYVGWSDKIVEHGTNLRVEALDRWSSTNTGGKYPSDAANTTIGNDAWVWEKSSFFRIKNITLGYDATTQLLRNTFKRVRVYADVQNPIVFTKWSGMDPETDGGSLAPYPNQVSFTLGVNLSF